MSNYSYIFEDIISTETTREKVKEILPILVGWAKAGVTNKTYGDLNKLIGYKSGLNSSIGHMLGSSDLVLRRLQELTGEDSPWIEGKKVVKDLPQGSYSIKAMRNAFAYAEIDNMLFQLLQNADARAMLRVILINEYLTNQPTKTMPNLTQLMMALPLIALVA